MKHTDKCNAIHNILTLSGKWGAFFVLIRENNFNGVGFVSETSIWNLAYEVVCYVVKEKTLKQ